MFHDWENYYLLIGSAAGALIGLMFVVTTLTAGLDASRVSKLLWRTARSFRGWAEVAPVPMIPTEIGSGSG